MDASTAETGALERRTVESVLRGGGEMGALMRSIDWSRTAVGAVSSWPQSLRTALSILLETGFPMYIAWGPEFTQFYNDSYRPILGSTKHPAAMGISTLETFAEIWDIIGPMFRRVMEGTATTVEDFLLPLDRHGFVEECYFIFSYSPIRQEDGSVGGVLVTVTETTRRVLGERRLRTSQALAARTKESRTVAEACAIAAAVLGENPLDIPFAALWLVDADERIATLAGVANLTPGDAAAPQRVDLDLDACPWPLQTAVQARAHVVVDALPPGLAPSDGAVAPTRAIVLPIVEQGTGRVLGVLLAAVSPRLVLDDDHAAFHSLLAAQIGTAITSARALADARARAQALLELDRHKTAFFSNVSHEFRTPLTLMLAPTEEALASQDRALRGEDLETVHRNELRLLKLVNALLDFSRIEAGRTEATFEPLDLAGETADLASAFRSAIEQAGLRLDVRCPSLPAPVWVDRAMWEKIVLNLLSNALKFTFEGGIAVELVARKAHVELEVRDTGVGIPVHELPRVFERFHRVANTRARTHEGSGIGLALVRELVDMHGGTITVTSAPGVGTTFRVTIPLGRNHLPNDRVVERPSDAFVRNAPAFVAEALRWRAPRRVLPTAADDAAAVRIVVVDDNADMRDYLIRLLGERWTVEAFADGLSAAAAIESAPPDLVLTDVMMPGLDGIALVRRLRSDERTRGVPVIMLSARAGEQARVEGLDAGADDYLSKPFSAREILARVQAQIVTTKVRSVEQAHARRLAMVFEQAPVAVAILEGPEHVFALANPRYLELVDHREMVGRSVRDALPELEGQGIYELLDRVFRTGQPHDGREVRLLLRRDGALREAFFDFRYQPLFDQRGRVTAIAAVAFEVTDLVLARREAESANRAKDGFLAMLGHELRNPLAPILTALELMRIDGRVGAHREREVIERQVRHLVGLVDDLLDISRITRGGVQLKREHVDIADVVATAIEMAAPAIERSSHELRVEVERGLIVHGDPARLAQVLANLLTNAAKYTDPGGRITVRAGVQDGEAMIVVRDTGVGIAADLLDHVFDVFVQERQAVDRSQGGLGLGLAIVRSFVEAHGGRVSARSDGKGCGSEFAVYLPLADVPASELARRSQPSRAAQSDGLAVLVVDDNDDAAELLAMMLRKLGHEVCTAHDGPTALDMLTRFAADAAVLDIGLPVMDGYELAARLRADPRLADLYLVALTGYGRSEDAARSRAVGFDAHLVKPIEAGTIDRMLREHRSRRGQASAGL